MSRILDVIQGSPEWHAERARRFTASEAPAMMGASKFQSRDDLLRQKATGIAHEVDAPTQARFDRGHDTEAAARIITEEDLGTDLYPVTLVSDDDRLLASLDGQTLDESTLFEHKLWSEPLAAQVRAGELEPHYYWQLEQELLVSGAEKVLFVCSDGTRERRVTMEYRAVPGRAQKLLAGWAQFDADLAAYVPRESAPAAVAAPIEALPAVSVRMEGALAVHSNLDVFGAKLREFIARIPAKPNSEQEFADCDAACKALKRAEEALDGAEANALGQVQSVEQVTRLISDLRNVARTARLASEKVVKARKEQIRAEEVQRGREAFNSFMAELNVTIGKPYMPPVACDFAGAIAGKKTVDSVRNAIDNELARAKIAANEIAGRIVINLRNLRELAADHAFLFADTAQLVLKSEEDCRAQIEARIAAHKEAEHRRATELAEKERERIREEEAAKLRREQREAQEAEDALIASFESSARRIEHDSVPYIEKAIATYESVAKDWENDPRPRVVAAFLACRAYLKDRLEAAQAREAAAPAPTPAPAAIASPALSSQAAAPVVVSMARTSAPTSPPSLKLGEINQRLAPLSITVDGLAKLGFPAAAKQGAAVLFHDADFPRMCDSIVAHVRMAQQERAAA